MIHPFCKEDIWCYVVVSIGALCSFVGLVVACICSCRQNENKSEFSGLPGLVKLNNVENEDSTDKPKAYVQDNCDNGISKANRSLPDIPKDKSDNDSTIQPILSDIYAVPINDCNQSELYATVEDQIEENGEREKLEPSQLNSTLRFPTPENDDHCYAQVGTIPQTENNTVRFSTPDIDDHCYAQVGKIPKPENNTLRFSSPDIDDHCYAQLQKIPKTENNKLNRNGNNQTSEPNQPSTSIHQLGSNPIAPPRARRSSSHNSLSHVDFNTDIQAANAISGGVQASQDLPYMTPPLLTLPHLPESTHVNQHFSGDSQDSKGYTSISVREPLANIKAQQQTRPIIDSHYATVSDDSDEMYAAIDERDKLYTSGSETYAQIQPTNNDPHREREQVFSAPPPELHNAPQPPSVDSLRHVANVHSRQASSSSATSSIVNPSSPKPEKRQANSPLPPPPEVLDQLYAAIEKKNKNPERSSKITPVTGKSLEEMYAKIMKKKKDEDDTEENIDISNSFRQLSTFEPNFSYSSMQDSIDIQRKELETSTNVKSDIELGNSYEIVEPKASNDNVGSSRDSDYEILRPQSLSTANQKHRNISNASSQDDPGYERVRLQRRIDLDLDEDSEPNYESMPHEPNYASVNRPSDSDTDPNYESVTNTEYPNYESVKYMTGGLINEEPPYEQVNNYTSDIGTDGYEKVKGKKNVPSSVYEQIAGNSKKQGNNGDTDDDSFIQV